MAACYLAGAGLSVAVLERASVVGGAAVTEELIPGFRVSTGSYVLSLMPRQILDELDLWSAGVQYLARDPRIFVPFPDGTSLAWWDDPARLHAELAKISKHDADRFADYEAFIERAATVMDRFILRKRLRHRAHRSLDVRPGDAIADQVLAELGRYAPNVPGSVLARQVLAPRDLEARFGLTGGHLFHGELVPEQAFDLRPVPGSTSHEGPIRGLYLCGSGAWSGGCVMGAPGHNAAQEVIGRLRAGRG